MDTVASTSDGRGAALRHGDQTRTGRPRLRTFCPGCAVCAKTCHACRGRPHRAEPSTHALGEKRGRQPLPQPSEGPTAAMSSTTPKAKVRRAFARQALHGAQAQRERGQPKSPVIRMRIPPLAPRASRSRIGFRTRKKKHSPMRYSKLPTRQGAMGPLVCDQSSGLTPAANASC